LISQVFFLTAKYVLGNKYLLIKVNTKNKVWKMKLK